MILNEKKRSYRWSYMWCVIKWYMIFPTTTQIIEHVIYERGCGACACAWDAHHTIHRLHRLWENPPPLWELNSPIFRAVCNQLCNRGDTCTIHIYNIQYMQVLCTIIIVARLEGCISIRSAKFIYLTFNRKWLIKPFNTTKPFVFHQRALKGEP
jgi:hypothetical protein